MRRLTYSAELQRALSLFGKPDPDTSDFRRSCARQRMKKRQGESVAAQVSATIHSIVNLGADMYIDAVY